MNNAVLIIYDEHYALCPECGNGTGGTSSDSRANLPGFSFDYDSHVCTCDDCGVRAQFFYEDYEDEDDEDRADNMIDVTRDIHPEQAEFNTATTAKAIINSGKISAADWQKIKTAEDIAAHKAVPDIETARAIADIMFIEQNL